MSQPSPEREFTEAINNAQGAIQVFVDHELKRLGNDKQVPFGSLSYVLTEISNALEAIRTHYHTGYYLRSNQEESD
jgi:hypothetical protein